MTKVSAIITTFNEEHNIADAIATVAWCDEIIVVDSFSTDRTVAIAKELGVTVYSHEYVYSAIQKNWIIPQAKYEWIVLLDADERITPELETEIKSLLSMPPTSDAYWIYRENHFLGKKINYSGWQNDKVIRFFKRDACRYEDKKVHEEIVTKGKVSVLKNKITHYTFKNIKHYLNKVDDYTTRSAWDKSKKTKKVTFFHLWIKPLFRFFKHYILKLGFLDGKEGFIISKLSAYTVFLRYVKLDRIHKGEKI